ncbi:MAG: hydantoinase/oxoprolinase family protein [Chloroflexota bacterium]|jgi:N-methylhydantoinase A|nr:hydantoinase/oxoprolinase family protein [Chloroflexota bacterium]
MATLVGVDVGGTFTDVVLFDDATGEFVTAKVPTTPHDASIGFDEGLRRLPRPVADLDLLIHGTTAATNAVLQRRGACCGLITTAGFRDVLELRRRDRPGMYGLKGKFQPLIERDLRVEVEERTDFQGNVETTPDPEAVRAAAEKLLTAGAESVVVSFINSYANPANERAAGEVLDEIWPNPHVVLSSAVLPEIREFERTSTAALSGYVQPILDRYLAGLMEKLGAAGYPHDLLLVQSNGGLMSQEMARRFSVNTILSGPAAGVIAAQRLGESLREPNLITCDIGGTSLDISLVEAGRSATAREISLEYGLPMRTTMLDIDSAGAGGGSVVWIDRAGILQVGPQSAGAAPGPVCYGQGGTEPTVTDANLVLGRIGAANPIGREPGWEFDRRAAEAAIAERIGQPLGMDVTAAAWTMLQVANSKIAGSIRGRTVERGHDPRDFALVAYGGAGPLHADALVRELELSRAIVPPLPGITSALGCIAADARHDFVQTLNDKLEDLDLKAVYRVFSDHETEGRAMLKREGIDLAGIEVHYEADMVYDGQVHEVLTALPLHAKDPSEIRQAFEDAYARQYGDNLNEGPVRIRTLRTAVIGVRSGLEMPGAAAREGSLDTALKDTRPVHFEGGFLDTPIYERERLPAGTALTGPAVIEQSDATTVLEPDTRARIHDNGSLIIEGTS